MESHQRIVRFGYVRQFLVGCEMYVIAPTAWYYVKSLGQNELFLAFVLCGFNATAIIAGPLFGRITDRVGHPRQLFLLACVIQVVSNILYSINVSAFFPLIGRLLDGLSMGGSAILSGQIALQTEVKERAKIFLLWKGTFVLGSAFGAGVGSFISFNITIFGWHIDQGNSPGIFLTIVWSLFFIVSIILPKDMWVEQDTNWKQSETLLNDDEQRLPEYNSDDIKITDDNSNSDRRFAEYKSEDNRMLPKNRQKDRRTLSDHNLEGVKKIEWNSRVFCLLYLIFCNEMVSSTSSFYVPILALNRYHLQLIHVKLLFLNATAFTLLAFTLFSLAAKHFKERQMFVVALGIQITAVSLLISIGFTWDHITNVQNYVLLVYICLSMPFFAFPLSSAILSKITDPRNASFWQGSAYSALNSAIVISRVTAGFISTKESLIGYSFVLVFLWVVGFIWFGVHYKEFVAPEEND